MFYRWIPLYKHSWSYWVWHKYNAELNRIVMSFSSSKKFTYEQLKKEGALWSDTASKFLYTHNNAKITVKDWSNTFSEFQNWIYLNQLMALSSYFETYLEVIIKVAIESDPGILIGKSRSVDGISMIKEGISTKDQIFKSELINCVKGDWSSRINTLKRYFGASVDAFVSNHSQLEQMRNLRNKIGHAFGRDIDDSREILKSTISPMERLTVNQFLKFQKMIRAIVRTFDESLMQKHIGNFLPLRVYHDCYPNIGQFPHIGDKIVVLKHRLGSESKGQYSKEFCRELINYYESI